MTVMVAAVRFVVGCAGRWPCGPSGEVPAVPVPGPSRGSLLRGVSRLSAVGPASASVPGRGLVLAVAWAALVLVVAFRLQPTRRNRPVDRLRAGPAVPPGGARWRRPRPSRTVREWLGLAMVRAAGPVASAIRRRPTSPRRDVREPEPIVLRRVGGAVAVGIALLLIQPLLAPLAAALAWWAPTLEQRRAERRRTAAMLRDLPEVVDLLVLAIAAGANVAQAVATVARRAGGPLGAEMARVVADVESGRRLADALDDLPVRAGEGVRALSTALASSERYGAALGGGLERLAVDVRTARRRRAEERARRVPVKLLFPLICCTLPAFALLTIAPLIASGLRALKL